MREHENQGIDKHPWIAFKHIKFISNNQPYEVVERIQKKFNDMEVKFNDKVYTTSGSLKQLNYITQKTDKNKSKPTNLDNRLGRLENT